MGNSISGTEAADRLAIRELIEADRRDAKGQMSLFTPDTHRRQFYGGKPWATAFQLC
jgi:hypothetical protein